MTKLSCLFLLIIGLSAAQPTSSIDLVSIWNLFAGSTRDWLTLVKDKPNGSISLSEYQAYERMKHDWHVVERDYDRYYHK